MEPRYGNIPAYNHDFEAGDFVNLVEVLSRIKGKLLMMTINDKPEVRELFGGFKIEEGQLSYSTAREEESKGKQRKEMFIANYAN